MKFEFDDLNEFWQQARDDTVFSIKQSLKDYGECRIGLSGGSTPKKLYEMLAEVALPWEKIKLITIDERYVPSDDSESNLRMIRRALTSKIMMPPDNLIHFDTSLPWESSAKEMSRKLKALALDREPLFDLLILGMGADGHIASLFPGDSACDSTELASTATAHNQKTAKRLTLCMQALTSANAALLLLKGQEKAGLPETAEQTPFDELSTQVHTKILFCAS